MVTINAQNKYIKYKYNRNPSLIVITSFIQFTTIIYINENIAKNYYNETAWKNIWFESWNISLAYPDDENINVDNIYISRGLNSLSFTSTNSTALLFNIDCLTDIKDNGAESSVGVGYTLTGDTSRYSLVVLGSSVESIKYTGYYSNIYFKVKDGSVLPTLSYVVDNNSYIIINNDSSITFENNFTGKVLTFESGVENSIEVDASKEYNVIVNSYVKDIKVRINYYNSENVLIKAPSFDSEFLVNYNTSFEEIVEYYLANQIEANGTLYDLDEIYTSNGTLYSLESILNAYLNTYLNYANGSIVELKFVYKVSV